MQLGIGKQQILARIVSSFTASRYTDVARPISAVKSFSSPVAREPSRPSADLDAEVEAEAGARVSPHSGDPTISPSEGVMETPIQLDGTVVRSWSKPWRESVNLFSIKESQSAGDDQLPEVSHGEVVEEGYKEWSFVVRKVIII